MKRRRQDGAAEASSNWQSYSDMMAALLLVFVLLLFVSMFKATSDDAENKSIIEEKQVIIDSQSSQIEEDKLIINSQSIMMDECNKTIKNQNIQIKQNEITISTQAKKINTLEDEVKTSAIKITQLEDSNAILVSSNAELERSNAKMKEQMDKMVLVSSAIISDMLEAFKGDSNIIVIDENTGVMTFNSSILFSPDSCVLSDGSQVYLDNVLPKYFEVLLNPDFKDWVDEIIIEGHVAIAGTFMSGLDLSHKRALAVAEYAFANLQNYGFTKNQIKILQEKITINGRSYNDPVKVNGVYDAVKSRRVALKFRLKGE